YDTNIDFRTAWALSDPSEDFDLCQNDVHSCGVHLLIQAKAYTNRERHKPIPQDKINLYRHQIAEDILQKAEPKSDDRISDIFTRRVPKHDGKAPQREQQTKSSTKNEQ
ncbi:unnamed protein product, partial [Rotaria magnacalcarata]